MTSLGSQPRAIEARDETPHEHGGERGWIERLSFNFFDSTRGFGGIASLEYVPGDRKATGEVDIFLPGGAVATALARGNDVKRSEMSVGRTSFTCDEPMKRWKIKCNDVALVFPTAESASLSARTERAGKAAQLNLDLSFEAWTEPAGWAARRTDVDDMKFARIVSLGSFEQPGTFSGSIKVAGNEAQFSGGGFRQRTWGKVEPSQDDRWFSAAFGSDLCVSVARRTIDAGPSEHCRIYHNGVATGCRNDGVHIADGRFEMPLAEEHARHELHGEIVSTIPPRSAEPDVFRSMTRFRLGAREALGLVETRTLFL
ncbi:MAG: hypothetical protein ABR552_10915 [Actinomycetota bacterium]